MKIYTGKVVSKKMAKTATIVVERLFEHPVYRKRIRRVKKYQAHDEIGVKVGDEVNFVDSKPFSKTKKWRVLEIVDKKGSKPKTKKGKKK